MISQMWQQAKIQIDLVAIVARQSRSVMTESQLASPGRH